MIVYDVEPYKTTQIRAMTHHYQSNGWRPPIAEGTRIIDIGGANSYGHGFLDAIIDIREPQASAPNKFIGDIDQPYIWDEVLNHAAIHGKWDFAICTHTLEDINNPWYAARMIEIVAKAFENIKYPVMNVPPEVWMLRK